MSGISFNLNAGPAALTLQPQAQPADDQAQPVVATAPDAAINIAEAQAPEVTTEEAEAVHVERANLQASFEYDKQLRQIIITLRREDTGEVVRQIPPEKMRQALLQVMDTLDNVLDVKG